MAYIKHFETVTNSRGDSLPDYRVKVVDSSGTEVTIYADGSGTRFTDSAGNTVNYAVAGRNGKAEFYWTPATGQVLQVLDSSDTLVDSTADFADKYVLANLPGSIAQSAVTDLVADLAAKTASADLASTASGKGSALVGVKVSTAAIARTLESWIEAQPVLISDYASAGYTFGVGDDSAILQAAMDDAEALGRPLDLERKTIRINSTVYCGSLHFKGVGAKIKCALDTSFTQQGSATRKISAAFLTKASPGADTFYGVSTVSISFDELNFETYKSDGVATLFTGPLFERTTALVGERLSCYAEHLGTDVNECSPLDWYREVRGVRIGTIEIEVQNAVTQLGGFWMRNFSAANAAGDWRIGKIIAKGTTRDELVALYTTSGTVANINDVEIGSIDVVHQSGGSGQCLSFLDNNGFSASRFRNISVGSIYCRVEGAVPNTSGSTFGLKFTNCAPEVGSAKVEHTAAWGAFTSVFGIRSIVASGQSRLPYIKKAEVELNATCTPASSTCDAFNGDMRLGSAVVKGTGSGWKNGFNGVKQLPDVVVEGDTMNQAAVQNAERVRGTVRGRMIDAYDFEGTHQLNQALMGTLTGWWFINTASRPKALRYKADVQIVTDSGTGLGNPVLVNIGGGVIVPMEIDYTLDNPNSITVSNDNFTSFVEVTGRVRRRDATGFTRQWEYLPKTITPSGTTGGQTINKPSGAVNFAPGATSLVVTNNGVSASSVVSLTVRGNDATMKSASYIPASGSFTIYPNAAPTAETTVSFTVTN